ncbi:MAG: hypothetical protein WBB19_01760 [Desulforhopalus sp.]
MQVDAVPRKLVDVTALSIRDNKTRRIFILADGKRSLGQIYQMCKIDEELGGNLVNVLLDKGYVSLTGNDTSVPATKGTFEQHLVSTADFVEKISVELANYIGPVAAMLVEKITPVEKNISTGEIGRIINILAKEIEEDEDRHLFLANMGGAF